MATITTLTNIKVRDIITRDALGRVLGYIDKGEAGVTGMFGNLNIRPEYQREFVYPPKKREAVINTIQKYNAKALSVIWFAKNADGSYELLDGQQRTLSICQYVNGDFSINSKFFQNLPRDAQERLLEQELLIQVFEGTETEKLEWFRTINIAGEKLTEQEMRNAAYVGPWLSDAKRYFSKTGCGAYGKGKDYLTGTAIRQDYLETVLSWINDGDIEGYMAVHQHDADAVELWNYFVKVINWVKKIFKQYRKEMKGIAWGILYNKYKDLELDPETVEKRVAELMADEDVTNKKGIYEYILDGDEKHLNVRAFDDKQKRIAFEQQHGYCPRCHRLHKSTAGHKYAQMNEMQGDHMTSWKHGGKTIQSNLVMLCPDCNSDKSGTDEIYTSEEIQEMIKYYEGE
jgi:hypothetical protein